MKTTRFVLSAVALASAAFAQTSFAEESLAYNVGAISEYRYRGLGQTKGNPALQGGVDYDSGKGLYVGAWASTIKWIKEIGNDSTTYSAKTGSSLADVKGPIELDIYGGYKFEAAGVNYDVGYLRYEYVGNTLDKVNGYKNANTDEVYGAVTYGPFTAKYSYAFSNLFGVDDGAGKNSKGSTYLDLSATFDLGSGYTLVPHIGRQEVKNYGGLSYTDYALTLNKDLGNGLSASLAAIGTNVTGDKKNNFTTNGYVTTKDTLVVGLKYTF